MTTSPPIIILPSGEIAALQVPREGGSSPALTLGLCTILCFGVLAFGAVEEWAVWILEASAAILFLGWAWLQVQEETFKITYTPIFLPMTAFGALIACQISLQLSAYSFATQTQAMHYLCFGLLLFVANQSLTTQREQRRFMLFMSTFSILLAAFSLIQFLSANGKIYWLRQPQFGGIPFGPYVNHNHYAGAMELLFPIPLVMSLSRSCGTGQRMLLAFGGLLIVVSIFISGSRGGILACVVELIFLAFILGSKGNAKQSMRMAAVFLLVLMPLLYWLGQEAMFERLKSLQSPTKETVTGYREIIIRDGLRMFKDRPLLGWGLGTFPAVYPSYRSFYTNLFVNQAHNDYLQLLDEGGILGFATGIWFLVLLYKNGIRNSRARAAVAALVGCTGIVVHSFTDFNLQIPANAALFFVLCGLATAQTDGSATDGVISQEQG